MGVSTLTRKGQSNIMEYIFMTLFVIIMIVVLIIFMSWFQFSQIGMQVTLPGGISRYTSPSTVHHYHRA